MLVYNVHGNIKKKLENEEFLRYIRKFDIIALLETHEENIDRRFGELDKEWISEWEKATRKEIKGRASGGKVIAIKNEMKRYCELKRRNDIVYVAGKDKKLKRLIIPMYLSYGNWGEEFAKMRNFVEGIEEENIMVVGDLNGRIGEYGGKWQLKNDNLREERKTKDKITNKNGEEVIEFIKELNLDVINGRTGGDRAGEFTFINKNGQSVIDLCLTRGRMTEEIIDLRVGDEGSSDHMPIEIDIRWGEEIEKQLNKKKLPPKRKVTKKGGKRFRKLLEDKCRLLNKNESSIEVEMEELVQVIKEIVPEKRNSIKTGNEWFNKECEVARGRMRTSLKEYRRTGDVHDRNLYLGMKADYIEVMRVEKEQFFIKFAQELSSTKDSKDFWTRVNRIKGNTKASQIRASAEDLANEFKTKLSKRIEEEEENEVEEVCPEIEDKIKMEELEEAITEMKNGKSPGPDGITVEVFKEMSESGKRRLLRILNRIWDTGIVPKSFKESIIFPIYKKGNKEEAKNYRGVSLLNTGGKIFTKILQKRMQKFVKENKLITESQAGYREDYSTIDHVYSLKGMIEICKRRGKKLYACFVDKSAAFDTVNRRKLIRKVQKMFKSSRVTRVIRNLYKGTKAKVWDGENLSDEFETTVGVRQGCNLSGLLFNIYMNELPDKLRGGIKLKGGVIVKCLIYADDVVLVAESKDALQMMINRLVEYCEDNDLVINEEKTKVVVFGQIGRPPKEDWYIRRKKIEKVKEIKFLGVLFQTSGSLKGHMKERKMKCKAAIGAMRNIIIDKGINTETKIRIYEATAKTILLYGAEVFGVEEQGEIEIAERYFYRMLYDLPRWTPKHFITTELGNKRISAKVRSRMCEYRRKVESMGEQRIPRIVQATMREMGMEMEHQDLCKVVETRNREEVMLDRRKGMGVVGRISGRMMYQTLKHGGRKRYQELDRIEASVILRARLELLDIGYIPNIRNEECCKNCGEKVREDSVHFFGKCRRWEMERWIIFGWKEIGIEEIREILNEEGRWEEIIRYVTSTIRANT